MVARIMVTIAAITAAAGFQFVAGFTNSPIAILLAGALLGVFPYGLWFFFESEKEHCLDWLLPGVAGVTGVCLGSLPRLLSGSAETLAIDWLAIVAAAIGSGIVILFRLRRRSLGCALCGRRSSNTFQVCSRCGKSICVRASCWDAKYYRCYDCERLRRPLLLLNDDDWWVERVGAPNPNGACSRCGLDASQCILRRCGQCPWSMCEVCWDYENGCCSRCSWIMPGLPESLMPYLQTDIRKQELFYESHFS